MQWVQSVQNAAALLVTGSCRSNHITPVLALAALATCAAARRLHKVIRLAFQSSTGQPSVYLADECRLVSDSNGRQLRSANIPMC